MEYIKIINLLDNTPIDLRQKNLVETNNESRGTYSLCQVYVIIAMHVCLLKEELHLQQLQHLIMLKNYAPFTNCISRINNTHDDAHDINVVMPM